MPDPKPKKFDTRDEAVVYAARKNTRLPAYDWYVVHSPDEPAWYVYRGGNYPRLFNGSTVIWTNGEYREHLTPSLATSVRVAAYRRECA